MSTTELYDSSVTLHSHSLMRVQNLLVVMSVDVEAIEAFFTVCKWPEFSFDGIVPCPIENTAVLPAAIFGDEALIFHDVCVKWGTMSDAYKVGARWRTAYRQRISFQTAGLPPLQWLCSASEAFPDLHFMLLSKQDRAYDGVVHTALGGVVVGIPNPLPPYSEHEEPDTHSVLGPVRTSTLDLQNPYLYLRAVNCDNFEDDALPGEELH